MRRGAVALLLASFTLLVAACGQQAANGTVIGIRQQVDLAPDSTQVDLTAMNNLLAEELAQASNTAAIPGEDWMALGELPIDTTLTAKEIERLLGLQSLCEGAINQRLAALATVRTQVAGDGLMSYYEKSNLMYLLDSTSSSLKRVQVEVARAELADQVRADIQRVAGLRVDGLLLPKVHLLIAGYQVQQLGGIYGGDRIKFQQQVGLGLGSPSVTAAAQALVDDLAVQVAIMSTYSSYALGLLSYLDPSGYPRNKPSLQAARQALDRAKIASDRATADVAQIHVYLHH
jgi:hypothetical protein